MTFLGLVVRFTLLPDAAEGFDQLVEETVAQIEREEPDTLVYACHHVEGKPTERIFYELYRDRAAFERHESHDHVKRFLAEREQYLAAVEVDFVGPYAAKGLPGTAKGQ